MLSATPAHAACPATPQALDEVVRGGMEGAAALDRERFAGAAAAAQQMVGCLSQAPSPEQAARVHQLFAVLAFTERDNSRAEAHFTAAIFASPQTPLAKVLPGIPPAMAELEATAQAAYLAESRATERLPDARLVVDGHPASPIPTDRPALVQAIGEDGDVLWSGLLQAGESLPDVELEDVGGGLLVLTRPRNAQVTVDGVSVANPSLTRFLPAGPYTVEAQFAGHPPDERVVTIQDGQIARVALSPPGTNGPDRLSPLARPVGLSAVGAGAVSSALWLSALIVRGQVMSIGDSIAADSAPRVDVLETIFYSKVEQANRLGVAAQVSTGIAAGLGATWVVLRF